MRFSYQMLPLLALPLMTWAADGPPPAQVDTAPVTELDAAPRTWAPGTVLSRVDSAVGIEVAGPIVWAAESGTRIDKGEAMARVDKELYEIALADSEAQIAGLEKRLVFLRSEADRLTRLAKVNSAAVSRLDESVANRDVAIHDLARARATLRRNQYLLSRTTVTAPFAGQIVERLVDTGEYMSVGQPVARLVDLSSLEVRAQAPLRVAPFMNDSLVVPVRTDTRTVMAKVSAVIPVGNLESRSFEVRLQLPGEDWVVGTPVQVGLPTATARRIVAIPRDALVLRESGSLVYRVQDNVAHQLKVQTGIGAQDRIEVVDSALEVGDLVVVKGAEILRDQQAVQMN